MPELSTLALLAGIFVVLFAGQAAMFGDTLRVQIHVPTLLADRGFNEVVAERVFSSEAARIIRGELIVPAPGMRIDSEPNLLAAMLEPLSLGGVVPALQSQFGIDHLSVVAGVVQTAAKPAAGGEIPLEMVLVVAQPQHAPQQTLLSQQDGDPVALVRRSAAWTMERVSPYRVALNHFLSGMQGDPTGLAQAQETAARAMTNPTRSDSDSWDSGEAFEYAMLCNINGLIAAARNDLPAALAAYRAIERIPRVPPAVRAELALNRAVVALGLRQPRQAEALLHQARADQELDRAARLRHRPAACRRPDRMGRWQAGGGRAELRRHCQGGAAAGDGTSLSGPGAGGARRPGRRGARQGRRADGA